MTEKTPIKLFDNVLESLEAPTASASSPAYSGDGPKVVDVGGQLLDGVIDQMEVASSTSQSPASQLSEPVQVKISPQLKNGSNFTPTTLIGIGLLFISIFLFLRACGLV